MQWMFRLTNPSLTRIQPDEPLKVQTVLWLLGLFTVFSVAGMAFATDSLPLSAVVFIGIAAVAIVWLATFSWGNEGHQTAGDWLMVIVGLVGAWIGTLIPMLLDVPVASGEWISPWSLVGVLPATGAFRGTVGLVVWSQSIHPLNFVAKFLRNLPIILLTCVGISLVGASVSLSTGAGTLITSGAIILSVALPLGLYFYFAYSLMPELLIQQMNQVVQQLPNIVKSYTQQGSVPTIEHQQKLETQSNQAIFDTSAATSETLKSGTDREPEPAKVEVINEDSEQVIPLEDWAKQAPYLRTQFLFFIPLVVIPMLLMSVFYWTLMQNIGEICVKLLNTVAQFDLSATWGWDWLQGWGITWIIAILVAILKVIQNPLQWMSLIQTTS